MGLSFKKMHGSGNDFILIDDRAGRISPGDGPRLARILCQRKFGVGADGLIVLRESSMADFMWDFFNADGSAAEMCGNGGRCAARFAHLCGIAGEDLSFETMAGIIHARVRGSTVKLELPMPRDLQPDVHIEVGNDRLTIHFLNTGVPHSIVFTGDLEGAPVVPLGRLIRQHARFQPAGTNVNFVQVDGPHSLRIRTYERGVEDETLACGTGAVASAILSACKGFTSSPVQVRTAGGEILTVHFQREKEGGIKDVYLEGATVLVYSAVLDGDILVEHGTGAGSR